MVKSTTTCFVRLPWSINRREHDSCSVPDVKPTIEGVANLRNLTSTIKLTLPKIDTFINNNF